MKVALQLLHGGKVDFTDPATKTIQLAVLLVDAKNLAQFKKDRAGQK